MSYDIEVKSDEDRSESLPIARLREVIADMTGFTESGPESFTFESGNLWMGLDCELMNAEGDSIGTTPLTTFNTVSVHIPYGYLGNRPERHYFPLIHRIAAELGWVTEDLQTGEELSDPSGASSRPWWKFW